MVKALEVRRRRSCEMRRTQRSLCSPIGTQGGILRTGRRNHRQAVLEARGWWPGSNKVKCCCCDRDGKQIVGSPSHFSHELEFGTRMDPSDLDRGEQDKGKEEEPKKWVSHQRGMGSRDPSWPPTATCHEPHPWSADVQAPWPALVGACGSL